MKSNRSDRQIGGFAVTVNNHPEAIIVAGFHGGFDLFQGSWVEQIHSSVIPRIKYKHNMVVGELFDANVSCCYN